MLKPLLASIPFPGERAGGNVFEDLVASIIYQQLSVKAADTIFGRFCQLFPSGKPEAGLLPELPLEALRGVGLSQQKAGYVKNVAVFFTENRLLQTDWTTISDEEILQTLTRIKGVGRWTAEMLLMFSLNRPDVFPADDLGIQQGIKRLYGLQEAGKALRPAMEKIAEPWRPYRSYACYYLWRWKDGKTIL